jgi:hypothetical protein
LLFERTFFAAIQKSKCRRDRSAPDVNLPRLPLFDCQKLICTPLRCNALPTIYPPDASDLFCSVNLIDMRLGSARLYGAADQLDSKCGVLFMRNDKTSRSRPAPPHCPSCAQVMRLARKTRRFNGLPDLYIFECRTCQMSHTEEGTPPSEAEVKTEIGSWYLDEFGNPTREIKRRD